MGERDKFESLLSERDKISLDIDGGGYSNSFF